MGRKSILVDRFGHPMSSWSFHEAGDVTARRERPFYFYNATQDWDQLLSIGSWRQIMSSSRFLVANVPIIRGALMEQARYSFPLQAHYVGKDRDYGRYAEEFLFEWKKSNNVRGGPYDQHTNSRVRMLGRKIDGDIATVFVRRPGDVFAKLQYIRAHRIGDRTDSANGGLDKNGRLKSGPWKGYKLRNGVISDDWGAAVAYRVLGDKAEEDQDIPASSMFLTFNPEVSDESRGMPEAVASIRGFANIKRLREYEMRAQQICAALTIVEKNATGTADAASDAVIGEASSGQSTSGTPAGLNVEYFSEGLIRYIQSGNGTGLEAFRGARPAKDAQDWEDKIVTESLYGIGWDPDFAVNIKEPGGNWSRVKLSKINHAIDENVRFEARDQAREDYWALCEAMNDGLIPQPKDGDAHSWVYSLEQERLTGDSGNDRTAMLNDLKMGVLSRRTFYAGRGQWWLNERYQIEIEVNDLLERATRLKTQFPELSLLDCVNLIEQRNPNGNASGAPVDEKADEGADKKGGK